MPMTIQATQITWIDFLNQEDYNYNDTLHHSDASDSILYKFDMSELPDGIYITGAEFQFRINAEPGDPHDIYAVANDVGDYTQTNYDDANGPTNPWVASGAQNIPGDRYSYVLALFLCLRGQVIRLFLLVNMLYGSCKIIMRQIRISAGTP